MTNKHTQGGWVAMQANLSGGNKWLVCEARSYGEGICQLPSEANARLIAASPMLLEALEAVVEGHQMHFDAMPVGFQSFINIAEQAIAKARGEV